MQQEGYNAFGTFPLFDELRRAKQRMLVCMHICADSFVACTEILRLKKARESGWLSEEEYAAELKRVIQKHNGTEPEPAFRWTFFRPSWPSEGSESFQSATFFRSE